MAIAQCRKICHVLAAFTRHIALMLKSLLAIILLLVTSAQARAEILSSSNVQVTWSVVNRFPFFSEPKLFQEQERAWRDYASRLAPRGGNGDDSGGLLAATAVLGTEHVLNDRFIPFTHELRPHFDWQGWAAHAVDHTCYDPKSHSHAACGGIDAYLNPKGHDIEIRLKPLDPNLSLDSFACHWKVGAEPEQAARCDQVIHATLPYPDGATISVNTGGESAISLDAQVKSLVMAGLGDSFASGEGNPDVPVQLSESQRVQSIYPARAKDGARGSALWLDRLCHRSLYSYQMRAALQLAIENPHVSVIWLGHACSGAQVEKGLIGPQASVEYQSDDVSSPTPNVNPIWGGKADGQIPRLLRELCKVPLAFEGGLWSCPGNQYRRSLDYVFLSVGGNDIGFAGLVSWATLRKGPLTRLANWFGATVSPDAFQASMDGTLGTAYQHLARQLEKGLPLGAGDLTYDPSRVILTAYPDILADEKGQVCQGVTDGSQPEDAFPANQSMDRYGNWLVVKQDRIAAARDKLDVLYKKMRTLADANGWTFAARAHTDKPFRNHGFCAQDQARLDDPAEMLIVPCWGKAARATLTCQPGILGQGTGWRPYDPATQNYPYALRQRWVRTVNDAYMVLNQKIVDRYGALDEAASERDFSATTGAMHPNAEGEAALADAMLMDVRANLAERLDNP